MSDAINPAHYKSGGLEAINVIEAWGLGFSYGNALKYILRAGRKDPEKTIEDLLKARWYIERGSIIGESVYVGSIRPSRVSDAFGLSENLARAVECIAFSEPRGALDFIGTEVERLGDGGAP